MLKTIITTAATLGLTLFSHAAEFRLWTSVKGSTIEAQLLKLDGEEVYLATKAPKEIKLKAADLSLADRQHLVEFANADKDLIFKGDVTVPEKEIRLPNDFLKKLEETMPLGNESDLVFDLYESEHFLFATIGRINPKGIATTAESCWHGMAFQHMEFRANWGKQKYLIIIPEDEETYKAVGQYNVAALNKIGEKEAATASAGSWDKVGAAHTFVPEDAKEKYKLLPSAYTFNTRDAKDFRDKFVPFQTHLISSALYNFQIGHISQVSNKGYFSLSTGHAYYKEILLAGKTETNMLSQETDGEIASKSGFKEGRSWARTLRSLVKKEKVKTNLQEMLNLDSVSLSPERLVLMYSFSSYMQSTPKRIAAYAKLTRLIHTSNQIPDTTEMAKIFGFDTVDAFEKDWAEFILSKDFR